MRKRLLLRVGAPFLALLIGCAAAAVAPAASDRSRPTRPIASAADAPRLHSWDDPIVGPEFAVSDPVAGGRPGYREGPKTASDGTDSLVVWTDHPPEGGQDVYGARMSGSGELVDLAGIRISSDASEPAVAFDGTNYLVVWLGLGGEVYGARVDPAGSVLDRRGIPISHTTPTAFGANPAVAFDGTNYLVVWAGSREGEQGRHIYGARVSPAGTVLDPEEIVVTTETESDESPALVYGGGNYLVTWQSDADSNYEVHGARVSPGGSVLDPDGIQIATGPLRDGSPTVVFGGANYLVAWFVSTGFSDDAYAIYAARVSHDGVVLDPAGIPVAATASIDYGPSAAFDGTNFVVAWTHYRSADSDSDVYGARVTTSGAVLDPGGVPLADSARDQYGSSLVFDGMNYLLAWLDTRLGVVEVYGGRVTPDLTVLDPDGILASPAVNDQYQPGIAFDGTNYLAAWSDGRRGGWGHDIYAGRVSASGEVLDGGGFLVSTSTLHHGLSAPLVVSGGENYLVAWTDCYHFNESDYCWTRAARVSRTGHVLDPDGIPLPSDAVFPPADKAIAFDGTNYLVVWAGIRAARVSQDGVVVDPDGITIATAPAYGVSPSVAFDGTNYLVTWEDHREGDADVYAARVRPDGTVLDPGGIPIAPTLGEQQKPKVAFDGNNYLVAWQGGLSGPTGVCARRVTPAGAVLDRAGIPIATSGQETSPVVAYSSPDYVVVWEDRRNGGIDLYGARIATDGAVLDQGGFPVSQASSDETSPDVTAPSAGRVAVAYARLAPVPPYEDADRAFLRLVDEGEPPAPPPPSAGCLPSQPHPQPPPPPPPPPSPPSWWIPPPKCHVPRVIGLRITSTRRRIRARHCRVGRIRRVHSRRIRRGRVVAQSRRPGRWVKRGTKIHLTFGRR